MRQAMPVSPLNPLPAVLWALALPAIAGEVVFLLGQTGLIGGAQGIGLRLSALQMTAFAPEMVQRMWQVGTLDWDQAYRILSYSFVNSSFTHALFVVVFTLASIEPGAQIPCSRAGELIEPVASSELSKLPSITSSTAIIVNWVSRPRSIAIARAGALRVSLMQVPGAMWATLAITMGK